MRDATPQERIIALRRVREERRSTPSEEAEARRRRRLTGRFQDVFSIRTTRDRERERSPGLGETAASSATPRGANVQAIPESNEPTSPTLPSASPVDEAISETSAPATTAGAAPLKQTSENQQSGRS
jgi:hypothetical protein